MYAQSDLLPLARSVLARVPGVEVFDAHVHIGLNDPAGLLATEAEVVEALAEIPSRALIFPLKEPSGYRDANARMIELAASTPGLQALARLDPDDDPRTEAERCLDLGAAGLKLHPRGEGFALDDPRLDAVFALADQRRLPVMIHAGAGDADVGGHAVKRAQEHPGARLILAHCAVGMLQETASPGLGNLYFDTSWWNPSDVWALMRTVPPSQILYASDIPFASPAETVILTARVAIEAGFTDEQIRSVMGGQLERLVDRAEPRDVGMPGEVDPLDPELERLYVTLCTAVEPMLRGADPGQGLELAAQAGGTELTDAIATLLEQADAKEDPDPLRASRTPGFDLVLAAAILARTPRGGV
jgi:predicted TIM-barrel fold metal-dependent hydrolase